MHCALKLNELVSMMVVSMGKESIESSDDGGKDSNSLWPNLNSRLKVIGVMDQSCRVFQIVNHVVDSAAFKRPVMSSAKVEPIVSSLHFGTVFLVANSVERDNEQIKVYEELSHMFIHPDALINGLAGKHADSLYISGVISDQRLNVFLHSELAFHLINVLQLPSLSAKLTSYRDPLPSSLADCVSRSFKIYCLMFAQGFTPSQQSRMNTPFNKGKRGSEDLDVVASIEASIEKSDVSSSPPSSEKRAFK